MTCLFTKTKEINTVRTYGFLVLFVFCLGACQRKPKPLLFENILYHHTQSVETRATRVDLYRRKDEQGKNVPATSEMAVITPHAPTPAALKKKFEETAHMNVQRVLGGALRIMEPFEGNKRKRCGVFRRARKLLVLHQLVVEKHQKLITIQHYRYVPQDQTVEKLCDEQEKTYREMEKIVEQLR